MRALLLFFVMFSAVATSAATNAASVSALVQEPTPSADSLSAALHDAAPLVRATAARVIAVRNMTAVLPAVREVLTSEQDPTAAREEIRALALLGSSDDISAAVAASAKYPAGMDDALAMALARRGGMVALDMYVTTARKLRGINTSEFFRQALWSHTELIPLTGSRVLGIGDAAGWRGLLAALEQSEVAMNAGVMAASLGAADEDIRAASLWYLVRGYALEPSKMAAKVQETLQAPRSEVSSDREDFGREVLRRMLGGERKDDPRWLKYLESDEADRLLAHETAVLTYLTDAEYRIRYNRCEKQSVDCRITMQRSALTVPSQAVAPPAFNLPEVLPAGLTDAIISGTKCKDPWLGVAAVTVDAAGRVQSLDLSGIAVDGTCRVALERLLRLSLATNTSLRSGLSGPILLARAYKTTPCLDEEPPSASNEGLYRVGGEVIPPKVVKRIEPQFPESGRQGLAGGRNVFVILECVISKSGCIRSIRLLTQSPFPDLNGAAVLAIAQWRFTPAYLNGKPVEAIFNMTVNFKTS